MNMNIKEIAKKFNRPEKEFIRRLDGRIEWQCKHGCGHTVWAPKIKQDNGTYYENYTHCCDWCCLQLYDNRRRCNEQKRPEKRKR